ncbi:MAG: AraC family transcriptional regulator [Clostridiales bacterium]|nr:AraC family transcriptional regulator [Clostridiales bacterium]
MNSQEHDIHKQLISLNDDEQFYKDYYYASKNQATLKQFLAQVDREDAIRRHLVIPELLPEIISYEMNDDEYFKEGDGDTLESSYSTIQNSHQENFMVINYIQDHIADITLTEVADHFGFSVSHCSKLIKSTTGMGFNSWKRIFRIRCAEHMLINTSQTVNDIALSLGYENTETFIRAFKRETHMTPSMYRKSEKKIHFMIWPIKALSIVVEHHILYIIEFKQYHILCSNFGKQAFVA